MARYSKFIEFITIVGDNVVHYFYVKIINTDIHCEINDPQVVELKFRFYIEEKSGEGVINKYFLEQLLFVIH